MKSSGYQTVRGNVSLVVAAATSIFDQSSTIKEAARTSRGDTVELSGCINYPLKIVKPRITVLIESQAVDAARVLMIVEASPVYFVDTRYICDYYLREFSVLLQQQLSVGGGVSFSRLELIEDVGHKQQNKSKLIMVAMLIGLIPLSLAVKEIALVASVAVAIVYGLSLGRK